MAYKIITFAIPCYNSAEYMDNCIEHLLMLNSKNDDIEIIIVDDGSAKDNTLEIAKNWEKKHPTTIKAIHQENGGHGQAVNTGLANATGKYFKVVDSDDWLDVDNTKPIIEYMRKHTVDLVLGNYVYNKVFANQQHPIDYKHCLPVGRQFTWDEIGRFGPSQYILMHSAYYRTELLKDINLTLPKHTFYVDNIFVYVPLPYVKSIYYIDADAYMYFIGRDDQSVNTDVMMGRIDQQIRVTKIMIDNTNLEELETQPKLCKYMLNYLSMMMCICSVFLRMRGEKIDEEKRAEVWEYLKKHDEELYKRVRKHFICRGTNIGGPIGKAIAIGGYNLAQKLFAFN